MDLLRLLGRSVLSPSIQVNNPFANELELYHLEFKLEKVCFERCEVAQETTKQSLRSEGQNFLVIICNREHENVQHNLSLSQVYNYF
jgi:hypothetical protein